MIISTSGMVPSGLPDLICATRSFDDVSGHLLSALADDLDAKSASFRQVIRHGDKVRLAYNIGHRVHPKRQHIWRQLFGRPGPITGAPPIPGGTGQAFRFDEWLDFGEYLRSPAYQTCCEPLRIHHVLIARLAHSNNESFVFGFHRAAGERRFSDADVARVGSLLPVLGSTLSRLQLAEEVERLRGGHAVAVPAFAELTRREREIATDVAEGLANKHIARRRGISVHTVENHLRSIFGKTGVDSRTQLALAASTDGSPPVHL
jgi:DNA-binding CsgD family transcriptional regulator